MSIPTSRAARRAMTGASRLALGLTVRLAFGLTVRLALGRTPTLLTSTLAVGLTLIAAASVAGQRAGAERGSGDALDQAGELTRLGRTEEAREILAGWWDGAAADASRADMQRGLWLRGRLTVDPVQAELDFQRLVVLYPSGPHAPDALFRLAQAAHARGDGEAARSYVAALTRDHPSSPVRGEADAWLRGAGPAERVAGGSGTEPRGRASSGAASPPPARPMRAAGGSARATPADGGAPSAPSGAPAGEYSVQLGAFMDAARALALLDQVRDAGVDARMVRVRGSRFVHVRVGSFEERPGAAQQLETLTSMGIPAAIVRDDRAEQVVRRAPGR